MKEQPSIKGNKNIGPEIISLLILVPLVVVMGLVFLKFPVQEKQEAVNVEAKVEVNKEEPAIAPVVLGKQDRVSITPSAIYNVAIKISADEVITYQGEANNGDSVLAVMETAYGQGLSVRTKDYGPDLGLFMEAINGIENNETEQKYWTLYVNGEKSPKGMSNTTVNAGDLIEWKLEKFIYE